MSIRSTLFPPSNREAAVVAFLRTFWQVVRATGFLGGAGIITVSATQLAHVNLTLLAWAVGAVLVSGLVSGGLAAGDILVHGLPDAYTNAAAAVPTAVTNVYNPPVPAPVDPAQPAAGTPPAFDTIVNPPSLVVPLPAVVAPAPAAPFVAPPVVTGDVTALPPVTA